MSSSIGFMLRFEKLKGLEKESFQREEYEVNKSNFGGKKGEEKTHIKQLICWKYFIQRHI